MKVRIELYRDGVGDWQWKMSARNNKIIGASTEGYRNRGMAFTNLWMVTGIRLKPPRDRGLVALVKYIKIRR